MILPRYPKWKKGSADMPNKYHADRKNADGTVHGYASRKEAGIAGDLAILAKAGKILCLHEQVPFVLVEGRNEVRSIKYVADFTWVDADTGLPHIGDAKGMRTPVYLLKKKMMYLLCGLTIEEL